MDTRAIISGIVAITSVICATLTAILTTDPQTVAALIGLAATSGAYVVGLYSEPRTNDGMASSNDRDMSDE